MQMYQPVSQTPFLGLGFGRTMNFIIRTQLEPTNLTESARDVVQATLTKAMRKLADYRGEAALFTWLCQICRSQIADHVRTQRRRGGTRGELAGGALQLAIPETGILQQRARILKVRGIQFGRLAGG